MTSPTVLQGSDAVFAANASRVGDPDRGSTVDVTVRLRMARRQPASGPVMAAPVVIPRAQHTMLNSASDADISRVVSFARRTGLDVVRTDPAQRTMVLRGDATAFAKAFAVRLGLFKHG